MTLLKVSLTLLAQQDTTNLTYQFNPSEEENGAGGIASDAYTDPGLYLALLAHKNATKMATNASWWSPNNDIYYWRTDLWFGFKRMDYTNFVQFLLPTYLAFLISLFSLAVPVFENFDARVGILGASLFVVVLNMNALSNFLGSPATMWVPLVANVLRCCVSESSNGRSV